MKKKLVAMLVAVGLIATAVGCGAKEAPASTTEQKVVEEAGEETAEVEETQTEEVVVDPTDAASILTNTKVFDNFLSDIVMTCDYLGEGEEEAETVVSINVVTNTVGNDYVSVTEADFLGSVITASIYYDGEAGILYSEDILEGGWTYRNTVSKTALDFSEGAGSFAGAAVTEDDTNYIITADLSTNEEVFTLIGDASIVEEDMVYTVSIIVDKEEMIITGITFNNITEEEGISLETNIEISYYGYGEAVVEIPEEVVSTAVEFEELSLEDFLLEDVE